MTTDNAAPAPPHPATLPELLQNGAASEVALRAPGRVSLQYPGLRHEIAQFSVMLRAWGVGPASKVALLLPNGPEMATAFLGTACAAVAAPLNPAYKREELDFYLGDLDASAVVVGAEEHGPILATAAERGIPVLRLASDTALPAGALRIVGERGHAATYTGPDTGPAPADAALILHTSGTTSRPKQVPLTHANLLASARAIASTLALSREDVGLNIMPLFHIHGLIAGLLAPLSVSGVVVCTAGFNALRFMALLAAEKPTWYSAVPTMHQAILERASRQPEAAAAAGLRFIRSSSASLPPQVFAALAETFGCPVVESYGMTEACHQMTSNPLPPGERKPGSVGFPAGPEVRIADATGRFLAGGEEGEIVIRGPNVTPGYVANPKANAEAFFVTGDQRGSWFRTGDLGVLDADGYLRISGRLKEMINRGGEKIAPREVDEVLLDHPDVAEALTFAMPHPKLGEEVAAAVVLRQGASAGEEQLRAHAALRLAAFKVPRRIVLLAEIPKGPTGKLQRIGLAQRLGLV